MGAPVRPVDPERQFEERLLAGADALSRGSVSPPASSLASWRPARPAFDQAGGWSASSSTSTGSRDARCGYAGGASVRALHRVRTESQASAGSARPRRTQPRRSACVRIEASRSCFVDGAAEAISSPGSSRVSATSTSPRGRSAARRSGSA